MQERQKHTERRPFGGPRQQGPATRTHATCCAVPDGPAAAPMIYRRVEALAAKRITPAGAFQEAAKEFEKPP